MKQNNLDQSTMNYIEKKKQHFFLIGFFLGIFPFIILLLILAIKEGGINMINPILKDTLIFSAIIVSLINAFHLKIASRKKLINIYSHTFPN